MGRPPKVQPPRRLNPLTHLKPIRNPTPTIFDKARLKRKALENATKRKICPDPTCGSPNIEDGTCMVCGTILDDSNIVAEVQFGENSSGAAVVQGSFVSADQGTAKSLGPAFRRAGGHEDREKSLREAKRIMTGFAGEFKIHDNIVSQGVQVFKLASMQNFVQGRRMMMVAAVCLYTAARQNEKCTVMMIDFADACQVNVFKLGHCFKQLHKIITLQPVRPVLPEDLIYRFAAKLEFGNDTERVALTSIRLAKRMAIDWMVMGRRPSGVCGACLIMAARMHNYRRTVKEVVYIVKVTTHTIQKRLDEFKYTESSDLTVEEFLNNQFLESAHDPPSFYEKSAEFQAQKKSKKRKRALELGEDEEYEEAEQSQNPEENQEPAPEQNVVLTELATQLQKAPAPEYRRDAEGFLVPPPPPPKESLLDPALLDEADDPRALDSLAAEHGDILDDADDETAQETESPAPTKRGRGRPSKGPPKPKGPSLPIDAEWRADEHDLEDQITEIVSDRRTLEHAKAITENVSDPHSSEHAEAFKAAEARASIHVQYANVLRPQKVVSMQEELDDDEFADDPEIQNSILNDTEAAVKEKIWVNENKDWLRTQQEKMFKQKMAEMGPPKATRKRKKKPRIGEGQTEPANSPAEAAVAVAKERFWSKKINYDAIRDLFADTRSSAGSATTSRRTSRAGSIVARSEVETTTAPSEVESSIAGESDAVASSAAPSDVGNSLMHTLGDVDADFEGPDRDDNWRAEFANDSDEY